MDWGRYGQALGAAPEAERMPSIPVEPPADEAGAARCRYEATSSSKRQRTPEAAGRGSGRGSAGGPDGGSGTGGVGRGSARGSGRGSDGGSCGGSGGGSGGWIEDESPLPERNLCHSARDICSVKFQMVIPRFYRRRDMASIRCMHSIFFRES